VPICDTWPDCVRDGIPDWVDVPLGRLLPDQCAIDPIDRAFLDGHAVRGEVLDHLLQREPIVGARLDLFAGCL